MMRYALIVALVALVGAGGAYTYERGRALRLAAKVDILEARLKTCGARIENILEAQRDAEEVDSWGGLNNVPERWIVPEAGASD